MFSKLWKDEAGIVAMEYLFVATIVGLALAVGLANLAAGLNAELSELANAILALSQSYSVNGTSSCQAFKQGTAGTDTAGGLGLTFPSVQPATLFVSNCP
jgi:Flp pilus assembly pilin Flp